MTRAQKQQAQAEAYKAAIAEWHRTRHCCHRGCSEPVTTVVIGSESVRGPGGILVNRAIRDRNYCNKHAPGWHASQPAARASKSDASANADASTTPVRRSARRSSSSPLEAS